MPTRQQFRAARALLEWSRAEVARRAGLSEVTIKRLEVEAIGASADTQRRVQETFEAAGVQWIGTTGVKLARRRTKEADE
jgi:DNA-binding XRE family transcriptional regulator